MQHTKLVTTNIKSVTNNIDKWYFKRIIIVQSHYTTVDRNIEQAYTQSSILYKTYTYQCYGN